jgi:hypothetical protein
LWQTSGLENARLGAHIRRMDKTAIAVAAAMVLAAIYSRWTLRGLK